MNSHNVTKRSTTATSASASASATTSASSPTTITNDMNIGTSTSSRGKRVRRVKRIRKSKRNKFRFSSKALPLPSLSILTVLLLICVTYLVASRIKSKTAGPNGIGRNGQEEEEHDGHHNHDLKHHNRRNRYNDLDAENDPPINLNNDDGHTGKYKHSNWMKTVGDHSNDYSLLRAYYDQKLPEDDIDRMRKSVHNLKEHTYHNIMKDDMTYDIHNCPEFPPPNYPHAWNVQDVLENWPPDDTFEYRSHIYQGLCYFDYETEYDKAMNYREAEVPFVVHNDPDVMRTAERWNQPDYLRKLLGRKTRYRTEFSHDNHFMYWSKPGKKQRMRGDVPEDWRPPTEMQRTTFDQWLRHANVTDEELLQPDRDHWYFRLIGCGEMGECDRDSSEYLFDELAFFQPRRDNELYMVEPKKQKGIHCRFGMKGVIAENHFDGSRNMIAVMGGERRYILSHPDQCQNLALLPRGHPSARHSAVDWSDPDWDEFPEFRDAYVNEVVLQAGDVLYLPTNWFHYIISLGLNFQCNTRSGVNHDYMEDIHDCGF